jgi:hypothetical protein
LDFFSQAKEGPGPLLALPVLSHNRYQFTKSSGMTKPVHTCFLRPLSTATC